MSQKVRTTKLNITNPNIILKTLSLPLIFFKILLNGYVDGNHISCTVTCDKDPGYSGTAIMLTESALSIILNNEEISKKFGVLTPASGIGKILIKRLKTKGIIFKVN